MTGSLSTAVRAALGQSVDAQGNLDKDRFRLVSSQAVAPVSAVPNEW